MRELFYANVRENRDSLRVRVTHYGFPSKEEILLSLITGPVYDSLKKRGWINDQRDLESHVIGKFESIRSTKNGQILIRYSFYAG